jgi:mono/diheme cytochrome c family protein
MRVAAVALITLAVAAASVIGYVAWSGTGARTQPGAVEEWVMRRLRAAGTPKADRTRENPVPDDAANREAGMAHFADHCAGCHGNDGSGRTAMGKGLWPPAPDMRQPATQALTDGELFAVIENGVRFTGMPAFGDGTPEGERGSWQLVRFIRRLPALSAAEIERMKAMNPQPPDAIRRQIEEEAFLEGRDPQ